MHRYPLSGTRAAVKRGSHRRTGAWALLLLVPLAQAEPLTLGPRAADPVRVDELNTLELPDPKGSDPLTPSEMRRAKGQAERSGRVQRARQGRAVNRWPRSLDTLERVQYLYTERHPSDKAGPETTRRADVYYYDYNTDEVLRQIVDMRTGQVLESQSGRPETPPPVTRAEARAGLRLILDHPQLGPSLRTLYREVAGRELTDLEQLRAQAGLAAVPPAGSPLAAIAGDCARHRCLQYFLPYDDQRFIDASNLLVDLSAGQVLWVDNGLKAHLDAERPDPEAPNP